MVHRVPYPNLFSFHFGVCQILLNQSMCSYKSNWNDLRLFPFLFVRNLRDLSPQIQFCVFFVCVCFYKEINTEEIYYRSFIPLSHKSLRCSLRCHTNHCTYCLNLDMFRVHFDAMEGAYMKFHFLPHNS